MLYTHFDTVHSMFTHYDTVHTQFDIVQTHFGTVHTHCSHAMKQDILTLTKYTHTYT